MVSKTENDFLEEYHRSTGRVSLTLDPDTMDALFSVDAYWDRIEHILPFVYDFYGQAYQVEQLIDKCKELINAVDEHKKKEKIDLLVRKVKERNETNV